MQMDTPLDQTVLGARSFISGLMIDLSLSRVMQSMNDLDIMEEEAIESGDDAALSEYISDRLFFEKSIINLLQERKNIMPEIYMA